MTDAYALNRILVNVYSLVPYLIGNIDDFNHGISQTNIFNAVE
jgi:hypothetical protein